jgi:hypothetical protein
LARPAEGLGGRSHFNGLTGLRIHPSAGPGGGSRQPGRGRRLPRRAYTPAIGAGRQPTGATYRCRGYTARRGPLRPGYRDLIRSARPSASRAPRDGASHKAPDRLAPAEAKMAAPRTGRSARSRPRQRRTRHARGIGDHVAQDPERLSRYVTIAGCGRRTRFAVQQTATQIRLILRIIHVSATSG